MIVGVPREIYPKERRVALVPAVIPNLKKAGLEVYVEAGAGLAAGYPDKEYAEKSAKIPDELGVRQSHGGLGGERGNEIHILVGEGYHLPGYEVLGVQELENADDLPFVVGERHNQHGLRSVAGGPVIFPGTAEVEPFRLVNIGDIHRLSGQRYVRGYMRMVWRPLHVEGHRGKLE